MKPVSQCAPIINLLDTTSRKIHTQKTKTLSANTECPVNRLRLATLQCKPKQANNGKNKKGHVISIILRVISSKHELSNNFNESWNFIVKQFLFCKGNYQTYQHVCRYKICSLAMSKCLRFCNI